MSRKEVLYTPYNGAVLLENPLLNKGLAFIKEERDNFNLHGLLPHNVETIEEQTERAWVQFCHFKSDISRHVYLRNIQDTNETLFYNLLRSHLKETLPIIYTPTVGEACEHSPPFIAARVACLFHGLTAIVLMRCCRASRAMIFA
jgi:malate dehydrogenase (oxaloacetate-decarboxylating)